MTKEKAKAYTPSEVEKKWSQFWQDSGLLTADSKSEKPPYCIVIPPPNVTGKLHMGHALVNTIQDIAIRWHRMRGYEVLWVPGTDHAGIATQAVVERHLRQTEGKRRKDYSREEFLKHCWKWKEDYESSILNQFKKIGCSCDWSRLRFTMDEGCSNAVQTAFKKLFDDGLIYRGDYLVNWDPVTQTALADDEVEYEERESFLHYIRYPVENSDRFLTIATTRPETMLGDVAVAVHPSDERFKDLIGQNIILPLVNKKIPVLADAFVDPEFGTGAVKITPAHDPNDYQMGIRHELEMINILNLDGTLNEKGGKYEGLTTSKAREKVLEDLKATGLLEKQEAHSHRVGVSYRSKAVIEPMLSKQWFFKLSAFKKELRAAVENHEVELVPENWKNTYFHWIDNLRDWCISRQLWWGHRIPIWYHKEDPERILCSENEQTPQEVLDHPDQWTQEEDVLDTWFSSALWPFSTLGWPEQTPDLEKFYPNHLLVTGFDILFFWVARMLLMGHLFKKEFPFPKVFLTGLIYAKSYWTEDSDGEVHFVKGQERIDYDLGKPLAKGVKSKWEKMSKSKGNVIDPLEICDSYGTDAMRMALTASLTDSRQIDLDRRRFDDFKNFANKVYNGAKFVFMNLSQDDPLTEEHLLEGLDQDHLRIEDKWILSLLSHTVEKVNQSLENYSFNEAALMAYEFFWKEFCAYYVEISKPILWKKAGIDEERRNKQRILALTLSTSLRLLHPIAPFITEELFEQLKALLPCTSSTGAVDAYTEEFIKAQASECCMVSPYPKALNPFNFSRNIQETFEVITHLIYKVRNLRAEMKILTGTPTDLYLVSNVAHPALEVLKKSEYILRALLPLDQIHFMESEPKLSLAATAQADSITLLVPLPESMQKLERERLEKQIINISFSIEKMKNKLSNEAFITKAPKALVEKQRSDLKLLEGEYAVIHEKLKLLRQNV